MAESLKNIKTRIDATNKTSQITKAMEMVSTNKIKKFEKRAIEAKNFTVKTSNAIARISIAADQKYMKKPDKGVPGYFIITSDKGLAGTYNTNMLKTLKEKLKNIEEYKIYVVGRSGVDNLKSAGFEIHKSLVGFGDDVRITTLDRIQKDILDDYNNKVINSLEVVGTNYKNMLTQEVIDFELLPFDFAKMHQQFLNIENPEPDFFEINVTDQEIDAILEFYFKSLLYCFLLIGKASEHASRKIAMKNATDNANEISQDLMIYYNKVRQEKITTELSEIVAGMMIK